MRIDEQSLCLPLGKFRPPLRLRKCFTELPNAFNGQIPTIQIQYPSNSFIEPTHCPKSRLSFERCLKMPRKELF